MATEFTDTLTVTGTSAGTDTTGDVGGVPATMSVALDWSGDPGTSGMTIDIEGSLDNSDWKKLRTKVVPNGDSADGLGMEIEKFQYYRLSKSVSTNSVTVDLVFSGLLP